jgi:hypothetical protein
MSRTPSLPLIAALCLLAQFGLAQAQAQAPQPPSSAPPQLERIEEGSDTPITTAPLPTKKDDKRIKERRDNQGGREVEVKSLGKSSYTMKSTPPGTANTSAAGTGSTLGAPQWKVLEFNFGKKKPPKGDEDTSNTGDAGPPPDTVAAPGKAPARPTTPASTTAPAGK